jgi:signal transduction histidine kinase
MLQRSATDVALVKRNARIIVDEVSKLENILSDLLDFTRPSRPHFADCAVRTVVDASVLAVQARAEQRGARIEVEVAPELPSVPMDCGQMQQVITNLVINALDASREGGTVTVRAWREDNLLKLAITDAGQGIPKAHLDQIFDTFFTTKPTGTGLGLALARKVLDDHGATMEVASEEGVGTTFTIGFNLEQGAPPALVTPEIIRGKLQEGSRGNGAANDTSH